MIVRNLLNNVAASGNNSLDLSGIGTGIYAPVRFESVGSVTSIRLIYYRGGSSTGVAATVIPYENTVVDVSSMASAVPSIMEVTKTSAGSVWDYVIVNYVEGSTTYNLTLRVINNSCAKAKYATGSSTANLTDYGNGKFNHLDSALSYVSPLTGQPFNNKVTYGQTANSQTLGGGITNGYMWNIANPSDVTLTSGGNTWGYVRYERKQPYCPDAKKRVTLKWLNSYGLYDSMYFLQYRVQPTYQTNYSGGNRVTSYNVTVSVVVTSDNENALYWLSRSADVQGVFPIATNQWAKVAITNPTAFNSQGGALGRTVSYTCKFEIIEP
jgi:hypothetical protein